LEIARLAPNFFYFIGKFMRTGIANFTLDFGKCPSWLFERMVRLGRAMCEIIVAEYGPEEFIKRLADPVWFQSLGTVLAFDWNASGLTTVLCGALKEAIRGQERDLGIFICGGKGKTSLKTPEQIVDWSSRLCLSEQTSDNLVYNSKMAAKVDSSLVQDGYELYHHVFLFTRSGAWTVVQQGMNKKNQTARRYHWFSQNINDLVCEPHSGISSQIKIDKVLNLTALASGEARQISVDLVKEAGFSQLMKDFQLLEKYATPLNQMVRIRQLAENSKEQLTLLNLENKEFRYHPVVHENFAKSKYLQKILWQACQAKPDNYEKLLALRGVGGKTMRALALVGEVVYGAKLSFRDPARYSFAHGGKDATPYPVDRPTYDKTIRTMETLKELVNKAKIESVEKNKILRRIDK
jgi:hypothetical protein